MRGVADSSRPSVQAGPPTCIQHVGHIIADLQVVPRVRGVTAKQQAGAQQHSQQPATGSVCRRHCAAAAARAVARPATGCRSASPGATSRSRAAGRPPQQWFARVSAHARNPGPQTVLKPGERPHAPLEHRVHSRTALVTKQPCHSQAAFVSTNACRAQAEGATGRHKQPQGLAPGCGAPPSPLPPLSGGIAAGGAAGRCVMTLGVQSCCDQMATQGAAACPCACCQGPSPTPRRSRPAASSAGAGATRARAIGGCLQAQPAVSRQPGAAAIKPSASSPWPR